MIQIEGGTRANSRSITGSDWRDSQSGRAERAIAFEVFREPPLTGTNRNALRRKVVRFSCHSHNEENNR